MAKDKKKSAAETPRNAPWGGRPAPTIDLKATDITQPAPDGGPAEPPDASAAAPEAPSAAAETAGGDVSTPSGEPAGDHASQSDAPPIPPQAEGQATAAANGARPSEQPEEPRAPPGDPPPRRSAAASFFAGLLGGAVVAAAIAGGLWAYWGVPAQQSDVAANSKRLSELASKLDSVAAQKPAPAASPQDLAALSQRVRKLETAASMTATSVPDSGVQELRKQVADIGNKLGGFDKSLAELRGEIGRLQQRNEQIAAAADAAKAAVDDAQSTRSSGAVSDQAALTGLRGRIASLENSIKAQQAALDKQQTDLADQQTELAKQRTQLVQQRKAPPPDRGLRLAIAAEALQGAVARGGPFQAELATAAALAPDAKALAPLKPFAADGVPSAADLAQQLRQKLQAMQRATPPTEPDDEGFFDRLQANAARIVRIRPIEQQASQPESAVLGRTEELAAQGNIAAAQRELGKLPANERAQVEDWMKAVQARAAAIDASRQFAQAAIRSLAQRTE